MTTSITEAGYARGRFFTRNSSSGTNRTCGDIFFEKDGEERTSALPLFALKKAFPKAAQTLEAHCLGLEQQFKDAVQVDFEISDHELRLGAPTPLERTPRAAVAIACSMVREGLLSKSEAICRVKAEEMRRLLLPSFLEAQVRQALRKDRLLTQGAESLGGAISGILAFDSASAWDYHEQDLPVILCCEELTYLQRDALMAVSGLIVARGSILAAGQFERPCVVTGDLALENGQAQFHEKVLCKGDWISLDGETGQVFAGKLEILPGQLSDDALTLLRWADEVRRIEVRSNVSTVEDIRQAVAFGAQGVGLCRIEALFEREERLPLFQVALKVICMGGPEDSPAIQRLIEGVEEEACAFFRAAQDFPDGAITVRLFDAPLSVMLHHWRDHTDLPPDYFEAPMLAWLSELNPVQGLRFGRLSIMYPVLMRLQVRLLLRAWARAADPKNTVKLQIMMPGVTDVQELRFLRECARDVAEEERLTPPEIGSMLELPRACLTADELCCEADFLSFGTGDLTESTCGISRYDSQLSFLPVYLERGVFPRDPFGSLDQRGVGALMRLATESVHAKCPTFELGTCGAQAIDGESLKFCCRIGLRYVSVPAHHVPVARLVAAQSALDAEQ